MLYNLPICFFSSPTKQFIIILLQRSFSQLGNVLTHPKSTFRILQKGWRNCIAYMVKLHYVYQWFGLLYIELFPHTLDYILYLILSILYQSIQLIHKMGNKQTVFTEEQLDNYVVSKMYLVCTQKNKRLITKLYFLNLYYFTPINILFRIQHF